MSIEDHPEQRNQNLEMDDIDILEFSSELYPDQRRVKVVFHLSPFSENPNASISINNQQGDILTSVNIVNIFSSDNEITLHIPAKQNTPGVYTVTIELFHVQEETSNGSQEDHLSLKTIPLGSSSSTFSIL
jgi:hypothetical protein